jgi:hypothetical protein
MAKAIVTRLLSPPDLASTPDLKEYRGILEKEIQDSPDAWLTLKSYIS